MNSSSQMRLLGVRCNCRRYRHPEQTKVTSKPSKVRFSRKPENSPLETWATCSAVAARITPSDCKSRTNGLTVPVTPVDGIETIDELLRQCPHR